jgi:outer membrane receptor protein involved in Fe transport
VTGEIGNPYYAQILQANTGALQTKGVDFVARYRIGELDISSSWTWTDEFTLTPVQAFPNIKNECVGSYGTTCGEPVPEIKGVTRVTWSRGPLDVSLRWRFIDSVTVDRYLLPRRSGGTTPVYADLVNPKLAAQQYLDLSASYDVGKSFNVFGGMRNLLNNDPPIVGSAQIRANTWPATYDTNGREYFLGVTAKMF